MVTGASLQVPSASRIVDVLQKAGVAVTTRVATDRFSYLVAGERITISFTPTELEINYRTPSRALEQQEQSDIERVIVLVAEEATALIGSSTSKNLRISSRYSIEHTDPESLILRKLFSSDLQGQLSKDIRSPRASVAFDTEEGLLRLSFTSSNRGGDTRRKQHLGVIIDWMFVKKSNEELTTLLRRQDYLRVNSINLVRSILGEI